MKVRNIALALAAGTAITVAAVAYAQPGGSGMGGYGGGMMGGGYGGSMMGGGYTPDMTRGAGSGAMMDGESGPLMMGGTSPGMIGDTEPRANMVGQRATVERPLDEGDLRR